SSSGTFSVAATATLEFAAGYTLVSTSSVSGPGTVVFRGTMVMVAGTYAVSGGTMVADGAGNFARDGTPPRLTVGGGTLTGSTTVTVTGTLTWTAGIMSGSGTTSIGSAGTLSIGGPGFKGLSQRTLASSGTTTWAAGAGYVFVSDGSTWNNRAGA